MSKANAVPAMVLGMGVNGLGIVRSLARAGVPVIAVDDGVGNPAMRTRYGRKLCVRALSGDALIDDLIAFGRRAGGRPVLFLTEEATVTSVSAARERLAQFYRFSLAPAAVLDCLMHKGSFQDFAERHGFRVPHSVQVRDAASLEAARELRFPIVLKPGSKSAAYAHAFDKAYRAENFAAVEALCRRILPVAPDLILQEWIDGGDDDIYFCLQFIGTNGIPAATFTGRKIRSWPPAVGGTASCTAAPDVAAELERETTRFFRTAGFVGMAGMEYKRDRRDGRFYLVEPTVGRTDYQEEVATLNGVNLPLAAYCSQLGLPLPAVHSTAQRVWRESAADRRSAEQQRQICGRGTLDAGGGVDAWWRWYDPGPWLAKTAQRLVRAGSRRLRWTRPAPSAEGSA